MNTCTVEIPGREPILFDCPAGVSVLDAAAQAGWELPYSCRRGNCETCRAPVLEGEVYPACDARGTALLCQVRAVSAIRIAPDRAERLQHTAHKRVRARLYRLRMAAPDVAVLDLRFPAGVKVTFKAGQYLQVLIEGHPARSFSMASTPRVSDGVQLHVRVLPGSLFGERILGQLRPGDEVEVALPFGDFYLREGTGPVLLLAGGTGFAPIQSLLEDALPKHKDRSFALYWGTRSADGMYAMDQVRKWQHKHPHFHFVGVISEGAAEPPLRASLVHEAVLADYASMADHQVYVCGAPSMVSSARAAFVQERGLRAANFYSDAFAISGA